MAYLTIEELKEKTTIDSIKNAPTEDDNRLQLLLDYCSSLIDSYVGFKFESETDTVIYVDGDGEKKLALPKRIYNIISVKNINDGYMYNSTDLKIVGKNKKQILNLKEEFEEGYGVENLEVRGDFGWEEVPADVINCLIMLCNGNFDYLGDEEKLQHATGPFKREKIGNYEYELKAKTNSVTGSEIETTGNTQVDLILEHYREDNFSIGVI